MRHGIAGNKLNRQTAHRKATVRDLAKATLIQERIMTTVAKAKEARKLVDQLITLGKGGTLAHKRRAFQILCDHRLVSDLFNKTSPRFQNRAGGYTRIIRYVNRRGDNAELAFLELTEKAPVEEAAPATPKKEKKKTAPTEEAAAETAVEEAEIVEEKKTKAPKKAEKDQNVRRESPKAEKKQEKGKKNIFGGVKKMFNRRQSGNS